MLTIPANKKLEDLKNVCLVLESFLQSCRLGLHQSKEVTGAVLTNFEEGFRCCEAKEELRVRWLNQVEVAFHYSSNAALSIDWCFGVENKKKDTDCILKDG